MNAGGEPELGPIPVIDSGSDISLPLMAYMFDDAEEESISYAHNAIVRACAQRFETETTLQQPNNPPLSSLFQRRYGVVDADEATQFGYGYPASDDPGAPGTEDKSDGGAWNPTVQELLILQGPEAAVDNADLPEDENGEPLPVGGCLGEAERTLGLPPGDDWGFVDTVMSEAYDLAQVDARVTAAVSAWSICMAEAGYDLAAVADANDEWVDSPLTEAEILAATADVMCKAKTKLAGIMLAVETAYEQRLIEKYADNLEPYREWHDQRVRVAAEVLAGS